MEELMTRGLKIYTAALCVSAIVAFVLTAPQLSAFAGMAVLAAIVGTMGSAMVRDLRTVEITSAPPR